ncbi:MAG: type IX secretion system outer membrane channel protein PorV [Hyphomicrobiales bacterium]
MKNIKFALAAIFTVITFTNLRAQSDITGQVGNRAISTAVPFLSIAPDARSGAMGDVGVATTPDASSMHWNAAKYAFIKDKAGFNISYSPWLRALVKDINLAYLSGYYKLNDMSAISASLTYFSLGDINFTDNTGNSLGVYRPNEFAVSAGYARKLTDNLSGSFAFKYINSNLSQGQNTGTLDTKPGRSIAADLGVYWQKDVDWFNNMDAEFAWGVAITNIGSKISYTDSDTAKYFIPTNLRFGPRLTLNIDDYNKVSFMVDVNKLLVPTPEVDRQENSSGDVYYRLVQSNASPFEGMLESLYKAPDGFSEKLRELTWSFGAEYWYDNTFALRGGVFYEDKQKGGRQYATFGAGVKYNLLTLDFSYLIPFTQNNPLEKTLRFSIKFDFPKI